MQNVAKSVPRQSIGTPTSSAESSTEEKNLFHWCLYQKLGVAKVIHQVQDQEERRENRI